MRKIQDEVEEFPAVLPPGSFKATSECHQIGIRITVTVQHRRHLGDLRIGPRDFRRNRCGGAIGFIRVEGLREIDDAFGTVDDGIPCLAAHFGGGCAARAFRGAFADILETRLDVGELLFAAGK